MRTPTRYSNDNARARRLARSVPWARAFRAEPWGTQYRLTPHYRAQSPFDEVIRQTEPGHDAYISELYAEEVSAVLAGWSVALQLNPADVGSIVRTLSPGLTATPLQPKEEVALRNDRGLQVWRDVSRLR